VVGVYFYHDLVLIRVWKTKTMIDVRNLCHEVSQKQKQKQAPPSRTWSKDILEPIIHRKHGCDFKAKYFIKNKHLGVPGWHNRLRDRHLVWLRS